MKRYPKSPKSLKSTIMLLCEFYNTRFCAKKFLMAQIVVFWCLFQCNCKFHTVLMKFRSFVPVFSLILMENRGFKWQKRVFFSHNCKFHTVCINFTNADIPGFTEDQGQRFLLLLQVLYGKEKFCMKIRLFASFIR